LQRSCETRREVEKHMAAFDRPAPVVRQVGIRSATDQVAAELRRAIVRGDMPPGSIFSLRAIAQQLGVSFIPVREALRSLEAQGLIVIRPGRSATVATLDRDDLHAIYRLRKLVEPEIAGRVGALLTDDIVATLEQMLLEFADEKTDNDQRWEIHRQFHLEMLRPAATTWDIRTLQMLWDAGERYVRHAFDKKNVEAPDGFQRRADAHRILLRAVASGDTRAASAATLDHLTRNEKIAISGIVDDITEAHTA
jgi:DNA-binding GntR family transcriptional regulator